MNKDEERAKLTDKATLDKLQKYGFNRYVYEDKENNQFVIQTMYISDKYDYEIVVEDGGTLGLKFYEVNKEIVNDINKLLKKLYRYKYITKYREVMLDELLKTMNKRRR